LHSSALVALKIRTSAAQSASASLRAAFHEAAVSLHDAAVDVLDHGALRRECGSANSQHCAPTQQTTQHPPHLSQLRALPGTD
jgi:hypothetical protein